MNLFRYINKKINDLILEDFEKTLNKDESEWLELYHKDPLMNEDLDKLDKLQNKAFKFITRKAQLIELKAINEGKFPYEAGKETLDFANKTIEDLKLKGKYDNVPKHSYQVCAEKLIEELDPVYIGKDISEGTKNMKLYGHISRLNEESGFNLSNIWIINWLKIPLVLSKLECKISKSEQKKKTFIGLSILISIFILTIFACFKSPLFPPLSDRSLNSEEQLTLKYYQLDSINYINDNINDSINFLFIKNKIDSLAELKESNIIEDSYNYKANLPSIKYYPSSKIETKVVDVNYDFDEIMACEKLTKDSRVAACFEKARYFIKTKTLQRKFSGFSSLEKEDRRKRYVKENLNEYKDSLKKALYIYPKNIIKPERPIRKCRWYEPMNNRMELVWLSLVLFIEFLILIIFIYLISSKRKSSEMPSLIRIIYAVIFSLLIFISCLSIAPFSEYNYNYNPFRPVIILCLSYSLLSWVLLKWSGRKLILPKII